MYTITDDVSFNWNLSLRKLERWFGDISAFQCTTYYSFLWIDSKCEYFILHFTSLLIFWNGLAPGNRPINSMELFVPIHSMKTFVSSSGQPGPVAHGHQENVSWQYVERWETVQPSFYNINKKNRIVYWSYTVSDKLTGVLFRSLKQYFASDWGLRESNKDDWSIKQCNDRLKQYSVTVYNQPQCWRAAFGPLIPVLFGPRAHEFFYDLGCSLAIIVILSQIQIRLYLQVSAYLWFQIHPDMDWLYRYTHVLSYVCAGISSLIHINQKWYQQPFETESLAWW